jgi:hypothetical protein
LLSRLVKEGVIEKASYGKYRMRSVAGEADDNGEPPDHDRPFTSKHASKAAAAELERRKMLEPLAAVLAAWKGAVGVGETKSLDHVIKIAADHPSLKATLVAVAPMDDGKTISNVLLARWLRDCNEVPVDGLMLRGRGVNETGSPWWTLVLAEEKPPE